MPRTYNPAMNLALLWGIRLGVLLILLTPFIYSMGTVFPLIVAKAIWSRSLIEIIFAFWVVLAARRPEYRPSRSWLVVIFALFVMAGLLAAFLGVSFQRSFWGNYERMQGIFDLAHWGVLLFVLISTFRGMKQWRLLLNAMVGVGLVVGLLGLAQRLGITVPFFGFIQDKPRLDITLGNPTYVGAYMTIISLVAFGLLADSFRGLAEPAPSPERRGRRGSRGLTDRTSNIVRLRALRVFWAATAILAVWIIGETASRGALAALASGLFFAGLLYAVWGHDRRLRAAAAALAAVIALLVPVSLFARDSAPLQALARVSPVLERTFGKGGEGAAAERGVGARIALEAFATRPITGWGGDNFAVPFHRYTRAGDSVYQPSELDRAHSQPLDVLATTGIVGFVFYTALWGWLAWLAVSRIRRRADALVQWMFVASALGAYFVGTLLLFDTSSTFLQFIVLAAFVGSTERAVEAKAVLGLNGDALLPEAAGQMPSEEPPEQQPRDRGRGDRRRQRTRRPTPSLRDLADEYAVPLAAAAILIASLFALSYRPFRAAQLFVRSGTPDEVADNFRRFPPLATYGQIALFNVLASRYETQAPDQRALMVQLVDRERAAPLSGEPENLRLRVALARFYRAAASDLPELMAVARAETDEALRLAPHTHEAHEAAVEQALAERDLEAASAAVSVWKSEHSAMDWADLTRWDDSVSQLERELSAEESR